MLQTPRSIHSNRKEECAPVRTELCQVSPPAQRHYTYSHSMDMGDTMNGHTVIRPYDPCQRCRLLLANPKDMGGSETITTE